MFDYGGSHGVNVVTMDDYDNCNIGNALLTYTGGISNAGDMYFICPTLNHCDTRMKLAIKVQATSSGTQSMPPNGAS